MSRRPRCVAACSLVVLAQAGFPAAQAQETVGSLFKPPARERSSKVEFSGRVFETADVQRQKERLDFIGSELRFELTDPADAKNEWTFSSLAAHYRIDTDAVLPETGASIPEALWDIELGVGYRRHIDRGRTAGLFLRVSSPSDKPFNSYDETVVDVTAAYRIPHGDRNGWAFFLNYGNRRSFLNNIPLPGVAYAYAPSRDTFGLIGIPMAMYRTRFLEHWQASVFYFPPVRGRARLAYDLTPAVQPYTRIRSYRDAFLRADREDSDEWLRHEIVQVDAGLVWSASRAFSLDLSAGYAFDRSVYETDSFDSEDDKLELENGFAFQVKLVSKL